MKKLVIAAHGDNVDLHAKALEAAIEAVEKVNGTPVYRAWIEDVTWPEGKLAPDLARVVR